MRALISVVALSLMLLSGCGDSPSNPAPSDPTSTLTQDVAPTSAAPTGASGTEDVSTSTGASSTGGSATGGAASATGSAAAPTSTGTLTPTSPAAPPAATTPGAPTVSGCTGDELSQDILGFTGGVSIFFCEGEWAYAAYPDAPGAPEFLAERIDGRWFHAVAIGDPVCKDDLVARGAPLSIAKLLPLCDEPPVPTTAPPITPDPTAPDPTTPDPTTPPAPEPCVIDTNLYGQTHADLTAVSCTDATAEWEVAEANAQPSWTIPWITPTGWECFVTPYDPTSKAAGACYGPDGTAYFTLYLP